MEKQIRWQKIHCDEYDGAEKFLRLQEAGHVAACARFLNMQRKKEHIWALRDSGGGISALLVHSRRGLYPVFNKRRDIPLPKFLNRFLGKAPIHAVQGLKAEAELLQTAMEKQGYKTTEVIDYDLMNLDWDPAPESFGQGPAGLVVRDVQKQDAEELFRLQSAYEQEEVLPRGAVFNPVVSRLNLERITANERMMLAELDGAVVGKINTSAVSFARFQIGGVYVLPAYRGRGIAVRMAAEFLRSLAATGRGFSLFVRKRNAAARAVYRRVGFDMLGDYRISYF